MIRIKSLLAIVLLMLMLFSCREEPFDYYERPVWLNGRVYTVMKELGDTISLFYQAVDTTGYDTIINRSGNYTVFAPSNDAFNAYFEGNPDYNSLDDIPIDELTRLVKYHIIQNPWSKLQLRSLDVYGWIDPLDEDNNDPRGFKRQTLLREENTRYRVTSEKYPYSIEDKLDPSESGDYLTVVTDERKHAPFFFQEYFNIYDLQSSDYEFYFDRPFEGSDEIYFANAKIVSEEHIAENGYIYVIDQVVEPPKNAYQILWDNEDYDYTKFLDLINEFPDFNYNEEETELQPEFQQGGEYDMLYDLSFPDLPVNIANEKTNPPRGTAGLPDDVTIRYHYGVIAPTNDALSQFEQTFFLFYDDGWGTIDKAPRNIKEIIVQSYLSVNPIYLSDIQNGFYNGELDYLSIDQSVIVQKEFTSNSTFIGINDPIEPRAFTSVAGPVYLKRGYKKVMYAIQESGLLSALKRPGNDYMLFVPDDASTSADSSFFYFEKTGRFITIQITDEGFDEKRLSDDDLRTLLLNHTGITQYSGLARKEFIPNLFGNFIVVNNETGSVSGTAPTKDGYQGPPVEEPVALSLLSSDPDNGTVYTINHWFDFETQSIGLKLNTSYNRLFKLFQKAGLAGVTDLNDNFILDGEVYTLFLPTEDALDAAQVDTLTKQELQDLLKLHIIKGELIFTDGKKSPGYYETMQKNTGSSNTQLYVEPDIDAIRLYTPDNNIYTELTEVADTTNIVATTEIGVTNESDRYRRVITYAVMHEIDKVLMIDSLDIQRDAE
jgi:uncharacterized surface protein with fasciclin (FAS1) repeats